MRVGKVKQTCVCRAFFYHLVSLAVFLLLVCWREQYHGIATIRRRDYLDLRNRDYFVLSVLVNTLQYLDTVEIVKNSETEDPHLVFPLTSGTFCLLKSVTCNSCLITS